MHERTTGDGSITCFSDEYGEHYHSLSGAATEAREKFAAPALKTTGIVTQKNITILDIGFGLGYNAVSALELLKAENPSCRITIHSLEKHASVLPAALRVHNGSSDHEICSYMNGVCTDGTYNTEKLNARLFISDARTYIKECTTRYDAIFLDAFSTKKNTELWTYDFFLELKRCLQPHGILVTYSAAYPVISGLLAAGLHIRETPAVGRSVGGIIASCVEYHSFAELNEERQRERLATTGVLMYRDETLSTTPEDILARYEREKAELKARGVPSIKRYRKDNDA
ncbi:MAG: hypothetical protein HZC28_12720 [Spirochaetes bacterium]|nr:hypothetical protein [Spirochaetota bacterium]